MQPARRLPERVALDVEDDVAHRGPWQPVEAALNLDWERVPGEVARRPTVKLQARLVAQLRQRLHAGRPQPRDVLASDAGDQHQVIFPHPSLVTHRAELAEPAVLHAI